MFSKYKLGLKSVFLAAKDGWYDVRSVFPSVKKSPRIPPVVVSPARFVCFVVSEAGLDMTSGHVLSN